MAFIANVLNAYSRYGSAYDMARFSLINVFDYYYIAFISHIKTMWNVLK